MLDLDGVLDKRATLPSARVGPRFDSRDSGALWNFFQELTLSRISRTNASYCGSSLAMRRLLISSRWRRAVRNSAADLSNSDELPVKLDAGSFPLSPSRRSSLNCHFICFIFNLSRSLFCTADRGDHGISVSVGSDRDRLQVRERCNDAGVDSDGCLGIASSLITRFSGSWESCTAR